MSQHNDSAAAFAERRQVQLNYVKAVVKVLAELTILNHLLQIAVCCANHAYVHRQRRIATQAFKVAVTEHAQQLGLQSQRQITNLIQEQSSPVRSLEAPATLGQRCGEGALFVAKEFVLHQVLWQVGAGKGNKRRGDRKSTRLN